jgi:putative phosphoribosyl transferase
MLDDYPDEGPYEDRRHAGRVLARHLVSHTTPEPPVVLGLPRGGVPVAHEVAKMLGGALDVFVVRKLGVPQQPELAMGAIASGGVRILNDEVVRAYRVPVSVIESVAQREQQEMIRRETLYRGGRAQVPVKSRVVVLVDDGLATGSTMKAAVTALRRLEPSRVIVAVPVGAQEACDELAALADDVVCALIPADFSAVGQWYTHFEQTTDEEVQELLRA